MGYDYRVVHDDLASRKVVAQIAERGAKTPIPANNRWVVERTPPAMRGISSPWPPPSSPSAA
ncbi:hypothetical protein [Streptomyces sp. NPDC053069]|uniref:hypothetical protein n=1 Tax=Streptomyces sp. NPDC053069 TaxID=3365695 RepID=UPI0037D88F26